MNRRRAIIDRGRKRRVVTIDTRRDDLERADRAHRMRLDDGGNLRFGHLPTADEQARGFDPRDEDA